MGREHRRGAVAGWVALEPGGADDQWWWEENQMDGRLTMHSVRVRLDMPAPEA